MLAKLKILEVVAFGWSGKHVALILLVNIAYSRGHALNDDR